MWDRVLSVVLGIVILGALGVMGFTLAMPEVEKFSEFYLLGMEGKAIDYPGELGVGEEGKVVLGVVNHEYQDVSYRVEIRSAGTLIGELGPMILQHEQKREQVVGLVLDKAGENQKVEFLLYKNEEAEPSLEPLYLWVNVTE